MYFRLIGLDNNGTDGSNPALVSAIYHVVDDYDQQIDVRIPVTAPDVQAAIVAALPPVPSTKLAARLAMLGVQDWATWTEAEALAWGETNIHEPLVSGRAALPAVIPFSAAGMTVVRTAIIRMLDVMDAMWLVLRALSRVAIAMRTHIWD